MNAEQRLVEQIVSEVMEQLSIDNKAPLRAPSNHETNQHVLNKKVITAALLERTPKNTRHIQFGKTSVLTPSAHDYLKEHHIEWTRQLPTAKSSSSTDATRWTAIVVTPLPAVDSALNEIVRHGKVKWNRISTDCRTKAAEMAVQLLDQTKKTEGVVVISKGASTVACRANRNANVRAATLSGPNCVRTIHRQMGANVYCINPTGKTYIELRNMLREISACGAPAAPDGWND